MSETIPKVDEIGRKHQQILYPVVKIMAEGATGSGTVIYSGKDKEGKFHTYVLTNHHVIQQNLKIEKVWSPRLDMKVEQEFKQNAKAMTYYYEDFSKAKGSKGAWEAKILSYNALMDVALLELEMHTEPLEYVANLFPKSNTKDIRIFDKTWASGASMGHSPIVTDGIIASMDDKIQGFPFWLSTAQTIYGNSGGALFRHSARRDKYELIGVPSRITVNPSWFSVDAITHMGYAIPIESIYKFLDDNDYQFIYDGKFTYEKCEKSREKKREEDRRFVMARAPLKA